MALAMIKATDVWKSMGKRGSQLVNVLIEDQLRYFAAYARTPTFMSYILIRIEFRAIFCAVVNILSIRYNDTYVLESVLSALGNTTLLCILGSRMFFNLMGATELGVDEEMSHRAYNRKGRVVGNIQFAELDKAPDNAENEH